MGASLGRKSEVRSDVHIVVAERRRVPHRGARRIAPRYHRSARRFPSSLRDSLVVSHPNPRTGVRGYRPTSLRD